MGKRRGGRYLKIEEENDGIIVSRTESAALACGQETG
jgi:hypothetical protein